MEKETRQRGQEDVAATVRDYYDKIAPDYDRDRFTRLKDVVASSLEIADLREFLSDRRVKLALDVGSGTGRISRALESVAGRVISVDSSRRMLEILRMHSGSGSPVRASGIALPFRSEVFDATASYRVLWHLPSFSDGLTEIVRVTRPGGVIIFDAPSPFSPTAVRRKIARALDSVYSYTPSVGEIEQELASCGVGLDEVRGSRSLLVQLMPGGLNPTATWVDTFVRAERQMQRRELLRRMSTLHIFYATRVDI